LKDRPPPTVFCVRIGIVKIVYREGVPNGKGKKSAAGTGENTLA
jgi:hypothetical protein